MTSKITFKHAVEYLGSNILQIRTLSRIEVSGREVENLVGAFYEIGDKIRF